MPPSSAERLLAFLKAKAANFDEVKKDIRAFHRLLSDVLSEDTEEADLIEPLLPLVRKLATTTTTTSSSSSTECSCLHLVYLIMCRSILPLNSTDNLNNNTPVSEVSERWFKTVCELIPAGIMTTSNRPHNHHQHHDLRGIELAVRTCEAIVNSGRVSSFTKRRFTDTLRRVLFVEGLVAGIISHMSNQHHSPHSVSSLSESKLWPFRTVSAAPSSAGASTPSFSSSSSYLSPEVVAICETCLCALQCCLPESFVVATASPANKEELLVLVNALNQPHNPLAESILAFFAAAARDHALELAKLNLFASPPTCCDHSAANARHFYGLLARICQAQNNAHTSAFATLCHAVQQQQQADEGRLDVAVFVIGLLGQHVPWAWLQQEVLVDVVYKLSVALSPRDEQQHEEQQALVVAACDAVQHLGRCRAAAAAGGGGGEVLVPLTSKLCRLCTSSASSSSSSAAAAAVALAWIGSPTNRDVLASLRSNNSDVVVMALLERAALEADAAVLDVALQLLRHSKALPPSGKSHLVLQRALRATHFSLLVPFVDVALHTNNVVWQVCLWEMVVQVTEPAIDLLLASSSSSAHALVLKAERSLCFTQHDVVQQLAARALARIALLSPANRFTAYQALFCFAQASSSSPQGSSSWVMEEAVSPALSVLDLVFMGRDEEAAVAARALGLGEVMQAG